MARKKTTGGRGTGRTEKAAVRPTGGDVARVWTLEAFLIAGPVTDEFAKKNPVVSRTVEILGGQTLQELHYALFDAFGRFDQHAYEFQLGGKGPMDPKAKRYVQPGVYEHPTGAGDSPAGRVDRATIDSLGLEPGDAFAYWFDFGDDWWHQINVEVVEEKPPKGKYPHVTKKVGESPPQYADLDEDE